MLPVAKLLNILLNPNDFKLSYLRYFNLFLNYDFNKNLGLLALVEISFLI